MNELYVILSEEGDEYKLQFTSEQSGMIGEDVTNLLNESGIELVDVGLGRSKGQNATNMKVLAQIEACIADMFLNHPNVIICFFCDFINLLPSTKKNMPVQEYRSRLFTNMFDRYVAQHHVKGIRNRVVTIEGVAENYYVHVIARNEHVMYADMIKEGIQRDFGKPEDLLAPDNDA